MLKLGARTWNVSVLCQFCVELLHFLTIHVHVHVHDCTVCTEYCITPLFRCNLNFGNFGTGPGSPNLTLHLNFPKSKNM